MLDQSDILNYLKRVVNDDMSRIKQITGLLLSMVVAFSVARLGAVFTNMSLGQWYDSLIKPTWTPSGTAIGLIWIILYTSMAIAAWVVWLNGGSYKQKSPLTLYGLQLFLNLAWPFIFFGLRSPEIAFVEIIVLWITVCATLVSFCKVSMFAGALMVPYLMWVSFAAVLNFMIWRLN
ncbi:MAG: TspO/MBR family protein [Desulfomonilaceae bacterium]